MAQSTNFVGYATSSSVIVGVSATLNTFASDNQTNAKQPLFYIPTDTVRTYLVVVGGETLTFSAVLVTSNVVNLMVNGVAMTAVTFTTDNATTLGLIATQLTTQFPTLIAAATVSGNTIKITPATTNGNAGVAITNIVVTAGASQATGTMSLQTLATTDEMRYFNITTVGQIVNYHTSSASTGQLQLQHVIGTNVGEFLIVNK